MRLLTTNCNYYLRQCRGYAISAVCLSFCPWAGLL